jgi:hypothetical protein
VCRAVEGGEVPSIHARERHCHSQSGCERCLSYQGAQANGAPLPRTTYETLWHT